MKMPLQKTLLASAALCATAAFSHGANIIIDSNKESHIREGQAGTNQGQTTLLWVLRELQLASSV